MKQIGKKLENIFEKYPSVKLVYFFGSRAVGHAGPMSDYDFAVYLEEKDKKKMFNLKFCLMDEISRELKAEKIDVVILNTIKAPEIGYEIVQNGKLIYEK
jgi:uncharacterized protein